MFPCYCVNSRIIWKKTGFSQPSCPNADAFDRERIPSLQVCGRGSVKRMYDIACKLFRRALLCREAANKEKGAT
jgi:hypothetical protein